MSETTLTAEWCEDRATEVIDERMHAALTVAARALRLGAWLVSEARTGYNARTTMANEALSILRGEAT